MSIFVVGINHKTAPVAIREQLAFAPEQMSAALQSATGVMDENLILSTCNRTEWYAASQKEQPAVAQITDTMIHWLADFHHFPAEKLRSYLFIHHADKAVQHALRVACGLDSMVLGEPQIFGQLKTALRAAADARTSGKRLSRLMQHAFTTAKRVRTQTSIGTNPVSVAFAAVSLSKQIFSHLEEQTALLVGAGETIELVGRHLTTQNIGHIIVANRSADKAVQLAQTYQGTGIGLTALADYLPQADIIIASTASPLPVIAKGMVERALKARKHRPVFMVDIAVPRDIEPEVAELDDVYLYTVDDLQSVIAENIASRQQAAAQAEVMVQQETQQFMGWLRAQDQQKLIRRYRERNANIRDDVLLKAQKILQNKTAEEALTFLANTLTNKLTHAPTSALHQAAKTGDDQLLQTALMLFDLDDGQEKTTLPRTPEDK